MTMLLNARIQLLINVRRYLYQLLKISITNNSFRHVFVFEHAVKFNVERSN